MRIFALLLLFGIAGTPVAAQVVRGRVSDHATREWLRGATVTLLAEGGEQQAVTSTDSAGGFEFRAPGSGNYRLQVGLIGYLPFRSGSLQLRARETLQVTVQISTQPIPVAPLVVDARSISNGRLAEFEKRRTRLGTGTFITQKQIAHQPLASPSSLLVGVPGVHVRPVGVPGAPVRPADLSGFRNEIFMQSAGVGECRADVFVDGVLFRGLIDDFVVPDWLGGVEVYATAAMTPVEYQRSGCGAVLFWTREPESGGRWSVGKLAALVGLGVFTAVLALN